MFPAANRFGSLDSLRGVAIGAVVCSHGLAGVGLGAGADSAVIALGRGGVTLFFLLSGYLIFRSVQREPLPVFLSRRFFKVMPSYWLAILVILALDLTIPAAEHFGWKAYAADALAVADLLGTGDVSGVFWTLLIEIKFYAFIAIQYAVLGRRHMHLVLAGLLVLEGAAWFLRGHGSMTLAYFPVFYLGIELALAEEAGWTRAALGRVAAVTGVLALSLFVFLDRMNLWSAGYLVASAVLFVVVHREGASNRALVFLGLTSYSTYLYHSLIMGAVFAALLTTAALPAVAIFALGVLAAVAAGAVLYAVVEKPCVRLGRRLETPRA